MIFRHDCGQWASATGWQPLSFRLHSGHFATIGMYPLLGAQMPLVGYPLAGRWLEPSMMRDPRDQLHSPMAHPGCNKPILFRHYPSTARLGLQSRSSAWSQVFLAMQGRVASGRPEFLCVNAMHYRRKTPVLYSFLSRNGAYLPATRAHYSPRR